jgi:hypothetical protein
MSAGQEINVLLLSHIKEARLCIHGKGKRVNEPVDQGKC